MNRQENRGMIIAISGMDGSGKSTLSSLLQEYLTSHNIRYHISVQPSQTLKVWSEFHSALHQESNSHYEFHLLGGLISWDRLNTQIVDIIPALHRGDVVICERYILDIIAWSLFRGASESLIQNWTEPIIKETHQFLCDVEPSIIFNRLHERNEKKKKGEKTLEEISEIVSNYRKYSQERNTTIFDMTSPKEKILDIFQNIFHDK